MTYPWSRNNPIVIFDPVLSWGWSSRRLRRRHPDKVFKMRSGCFTEGQSIWYRDNTVGSLFTIYIVIPRHTMYETLTTLLISTVLCYPSFLFSFHISTLKRSTSFPNWHRCTPPSFLKFVVYCVLYLHPFPCRHKSFTVSIDLKYSLIGSHSKTSWRGRYFL